MAAFLLPRGTYNVRICPRVRGVLRIWGIWYCSFRFAFASLPEGPCNEFVVQRLRYGNGGWSLFANVQGRKPFRMGFVRIVAAAQSARSVHVIHALCRGCGRRGGAGRCAMEGRLTFSLTDVISLKNQGQVDHLHSSDVLTSGLDYIVG